MSRPKRPEPVNFNATHEQPLADLPQGLAEHAEEVMHTTNFWAGEARPPILRVRHLDPMDLAVYLLCTLRAQGKYDKTNAEIGAAFWLDADQVRKIYRNTKTQVRG